jgi:hypothetical protein
MVWLKRGGGQKELQVVARLGEKGHDPLQIAASRIENGPRSMISNRPIAPVTEVIEGRNDLPKTGDGNYPRSRKITLAQNGSQGSYR